jgi:hypothetical protein
VNDQNGNAATPVEPLAHRVEQPVAPVGLADHDEIPAAGAGLAKEGCPRAAARHELGYRDLLRHQPRGVLHVSLRPLQQVLLEPVPAHREDDRTGGGQGRRSGGAAQESQSAVARFNQFHGPRERFPGGLAVVDSDEDSVEHRGSWSLAC